RGRGMQQAKIIRLETASSREAPPASTSWTAVGRVALTGGVLLYLALILVGPVLALAFETTKIGWGRALGAVASPAALDALFMSVMLVVISLVVNAAVGSVGALCLVRHRFLGRGLLGALF